MTALISALTQNIVRVSMNGSKILALMPFIFSFSLFCFKTTASNKDDKEENVLWKYKTILADSTGEEEFKNEATRPCKHPITFSEQLGKQLFEEVLKASEKRENRHERLNILLRGAGAERDTGFHRYAFRLFKDAQNGDHPEKAWAYRIFGDFYMGYRGLYEYAGKQYFEAKRLLELNPENYEPIFEKSLKRSLQIWHRDGQDGMLLQPLNVQDSYSLYFEPSIEYQKLSVNRSDPMTLLDRQLRAEKFLERDEEDTIQNIKNNPKLTEEQMRADKSSAKEETARRIRLIPKKQPRRTTKLIEKYLLALRFRNQHLPYFRFSWQRENDIDAAENNPDTLEPYDGDFQRLTLIVGKNYHLCPHFDLHLEAELFNQKIEITDPLASNRLVTKEQSDDLDLDLEAKVTYFSPFRTTSLTLGANSRDIDRTEGDRKIFDDTFNSQRIALRRSFYKKPGKDAITGRFRGRSSTHFEIGLNRSERHFQTASTLLNYASRFSLEFLGILSGHMDIFFNYALFSLEIDDKENSAAEGRYDVHRFEINPVWVMKYKLYENTFTKGLEFLSIGTPLSYSLGEKSGSYTQFNARLRVEADWVAQPRVRLGEQYPILSSIRLIPTLEIGYSHYPEIDQGDWEISAKCVVRY